MSAVDDDGTLSEISNQDEQYMNRNDSGSSDGEDAQIQDLLNRKVPQKTVDSQIFTIQLPLIGKIPISKSYLRLILFSFLHSKMFDVWRAWRKSSSQRWISHRPVWMSDLLNQAWWDQDWIHRVFPRQNLLFASHFREHSERQIF